MTGDSTVAITTSSTTVDGLGNPFVTSSGNITLGDGTGEVTLVMNNLDTLVSREFGNAEYGIVQDNGRRAGVPG